MSGRPDVLVVRRKPGSSCQERAGGVGPLMARCQLDQLSFRKQLRDVRIDPRQQIRGRGRTEPRRGQTGHSELRFPAVTDADPTQHVSSTACLEYRKTSWSISNYGAKPVGVRWNEPTRIANPHVHRNLVTRSQQPDPRIAGRENP